MSRALRIGFSLALVAASVALLTAQDSKKKKKEDAATRIVKGTVFDAAENPVTGAVVRLKDVRGIRTFITRENGSYTFTGLRNDTDYELQATYNGMESSWRRLSVFDERKDPVMNLKLEKKAP